METSGNERSGNFGGQTTFSQPGHTGGGGNHLASDADFCKEHDATGPMWWSCSPCPSDCFDTALRCKTPPEGTGRRQCFRVRPRVQVITGPHTGVVKLVRPDQGCLTWHLLHTLAHITLKLWHPHQSGLVRWLQFGTLQPSTPLSRRHQQYFSFCASLWHCCSSCRICSHLQLLHLGMLPLVVDESE